MPAEWLMTIVSIDSIFFRGSGDVEFFLDTVSHNPAGPLAAAPGPGDFNGDGNVNGDDLAVWQQHFGTPAGATPSQGDANGDGAVDGADFLAWQRNFSSTASPVAAATSPVPEPTTLAAAAMAALGLSLVGRRRR